MRNHRALALCGLILFAGCLVPALLRAQAGGQGGGQPGGGGQGGLSPLVPRGIDVILAYPVDNSLIVHDPPVDDPNAPPVLKVKAQWLEVDRVGSNNVVRRFHAVDSPQATLTSGKTGEIKVKTPAQTVTYPIRVKLEESGVVTMSLFAEGQPGNLVYRLDRKEDVHLGDSYVVRGMISPQNDGGQRETYLQFTFNLAPKEGEGNKPAPSDKSDKKDGGKPSK